MLFDLKLYFDENICCAPSDSNNEKTIIFNYDTFQRILSDFAFKECSRRQRRRSIPILVR